MDAGPPQYFVMSGEGPAPAAAVARGPALPSALWYRGAVVGGAVAVPLVYTLDPRRRGELKPLYDELDVPLVRQDLLDVLAAAGVDNLQTFPAVIEDPATGARHTDHRAFNVVGVVSAADMGRSRVAATSGAQVIDVDFERLVIDASRAGGALLFRLAESVATIVVHESVRRCVEASGIRGVAFYGPDD